MSDSRAARVKERGRRGFFAALEVPEAQGTGAGVGAAAGLAILIGLTQMDR